MSTFRRTSTILSILTLLSILVIAWPMMKRPIDGGQIPVVVSPSDFYVQAGYSVDVTVTLSGVTTTNQTVQIASSTSSLVVPSSVVVPAGHDSVTFTAYAVSNWTEPDPVYATIAAYCNAAEAQGGLYVGG